MNLRRVLKCGAAVVGLSSAVFSAATVRAQTPAATTDASVPSNTLEEVVVTAEKRDVDLQKTPLAVTAVPNAALTKSNVVSIVDLNAKVPGLTASRNNGLQRVIAIRGVGYETAQNISSQPGVALFVDGVYISNNIATGVDLVDVDRLEVLRGPQSTLYGQSSTGGVINMVTNQPRLNVFGGEADVSYGAYNMVKADASLNIPVGDTFAVRGSVQKFSHDGWAKVPELGNYDLDNANDFTGKVSALWKPLPQFSANLTYWHFGEDSHGAAQKNIRDLNPDPRIIDQDFAGGANLKFDLASLTLKYDFPIAQLKFIGGYQDMLSRQTADNDRSDFSTIHAFDVYPQSDIYNHTWTQELTLASTTPGPVDWIVGVFFLQQMSRQITEEYNGTTPPPAAYPTFTALPPGGLPKFFAYEANAALYRRSGAAYGQATWHATDKLRFTGGLRYSEDYFSNTNSASFAAQVYFSHNDDQLTGKAGVEYDFTSEMMGYFTYSRGYKPGGVNINTHPSLVGRGFDSETVNSYEVGSKNRFLDNRLQVNVAGFYYDYANFQYQEEDPVPYQGGVANIPHAHIYGAELEGVFAITPTLRFTGNATALGGKFTGTYYALDALAALQANSIAAARGLSTFAPAGQAIRAAAVQNTDGNTPPKLPDFTSTIALEHTLPLPTGDRLISRVEVEYRGPYEYRIFNTGGIDRVPDYTLVNLNLAYDFRAQPIEVSLTVSNLFDRAAIDSRFSDPFGVGATSNTYVPPRQVFGTVKYRF